MASDKDPEHKPDEGKDLPLIDVSGLLSGVPCEFDYVAGLIGRAARDIGFFRIYNHGIKPEVIAAAYRASKSFFALPDDAKRAYYIARSSNHRGYVPFTEKGDYPDEADRNYEAFDLGLDLPANDPDFLAGNRVLGPNVWPSLSGFKEAISTYYSRIASLGLRVCSALEFDLGLPGGAITDQMSKPISQLRLLHYVRQAETLDSNSVNMGAHTDYECLTLLHTGNPGLQAMTRDNRWIDVPVDPAVFVVNIGDMLEAWSNGILRSTPHRVLNLSNERYSIPYFVATNYDTLIEPFPTLMQPGEPAKYKPFYAGSHLERMLVRDFPYLRDIKRKESLAVSPPPENPFEGRIQRVPP